MEKLKKEIQSVVDVFKSGDLPKATSLCKKLIELNPKVAFLFNLMGLILANQKKVIEAKEYYEKGLKIDPAFAMIYNNLGLLYFQNKLNNYVIKSESYYKKSISLNKSIPEPHTNLGSLYNSLNRYEEAISSYKKAILINPKFSYAHHNLGNIYTALGNFDEAKKHFNKAIEFDNSFYTSHRTLSRMTKYTVTNKHFILLKELYKNINKDNTEFKMNISFALGKAYEDMNKFDESFNFYKEANSIYRSKINFSLDYEKKRFKEIKETFNRDLYKKFSSSGYHNYSPIFILGMPRSGTTLVEQILSSHQKVFGADEVEFIPNLLKKNFGENNLNLYFKNAVDFNENVFKKIGESYIKKMKEISKGYERTTDKLTKNYQTIGFIKLILPKSKIIHCYRNPTDNCFSIFKNHFPGGRIDFGYDLQEIVEYYNCYSDLMKYWNDLLPNFIFDIKYEKLVSNTKIEIQNLLKFCDLKWEDDCLNFYNNKRPIKTASDIQARSKIYDTSINSWKKYEKFLKQYFVKLNN